MTTPFCPLCRFIIAGLCLAAVANWQPAVGQQRHPSAKMQLAKPMTKPPFFYGKWKVIGYKALPVSAMSEARARTWLGRMGQYGVSAAEFNGVKCENISYLPRKVSVVDFVRDYRCKPADLGIPPGAVEVIEVDTNGHSFDAPGGVLIKRIDGKILMFWVGVFFVLQRM